MESRNQDYTINRPLILGPSHDALVKYVKVEGPTGVAKRVLNVTEGFRMSQVFSVVVNRQVFMSDQSKFESSLLHSLKSQWSGTKIFQSVHLPPPFSLSLEKEGHFIFIKILVTTKFASSL